VTGRFFPRPGSLRGGRVGPAWVEAAAFKSYLSPRAPPPASRSSNQIGDDGARALAGAAQGLAALDGLSLQ
jgi:hypothetical protein